MKNISGYIRILVKTRIEQQLNKPLFGRPYLKYGQCYAICSYFLQLGCILGIKHSSNLDAFADAFLGISGPSESVKKFFTEQAKSDMTDSISDSTTFLDFVKKDLILKTGYSGNSANFFIGF